MINCDLIWNEKRLEEEMQYRNVTLVQYQSYVLLHIYKIHCTFHSRWKIFHLTWERNFLDAVHTHVFVYKLLDSHVHHQRRKSRKKFSCMSLLLATKTVKNVLDQLLFAFLSLLSRNDNLASGTTSFCFFIRSPFSLFFMSISSSLSALIWSQKEFFISFLFASKHFQNSWGTERKRVGCNVKISELNYFPSWPEIESLSILFQYVTQTCKVFFKFLTTNFSFEWVKMFNL